MSTFTIQATLIHPDHRERSVTAELLVDTGAFYSLLPAEIVERLGLEAEEDFDGLLASGEPVLYKQGEVRIRIGRRERTTIFVAGRRDAFRCSGHSRSRRSRSPPIHGTSGSSPPACSGTSDRPPPLPLPARGRGARAGFSGASCWTRTRR